MRPRIGRSALWRREQDADLPASPPAHVLGDVARAARRAIELHDLGCELHFELDADHRVRVEIHDRSGRVVRRISPSEALELASGCSLRSRTVHTTLPKRDIP